MTRPPHHHYKVAQLRLDCEGDDEADVALERLLEEHGPRGWKLDTITTLPVAPGGPAVRRLLVTFVWNPRP